MMLLLLSLTRLCRLVFLLSATMSGLSSSVYGDGGAPGSIARGGATVGQNNGTTTAGAMVYSDGSGNLRLNAKFDTAGTSGSGGGKVLFNGRDIMMELSAMRHRLELLQNHAATTSSMATATTSTATATKSTATSPLTTATATATTKTTTTTTATTKTTTTATTTTTTTTTKKAPSPPVSFSCLGVMNQQSCNFHVTTGVCTTWLVNTRRCLGPNQALSCGEYVYTECPSARCVVVSDGGYTCVPK